MGLLDVLQSASNAVAGNVAGPVDLLSFLLRKGGVPVPEDALGGSEWMKRKGLMRDVPKGAEQVVGETLGLLAPTAIAANAPKIARGLLQMQENAAMPRTLNPETGAIVWHGSPHKFDKFDASKIGTGEGAQAYGHGIYTAESPSVAKQYADSVKDMGAVRKINAEMSRLAKIMSADEVPGGYRKYRSNVGRKAAEEYDALMAQRDGVRTAPGNLYKVDLPDTAIAKMLDWDKPLSQQAPEVQAAVKQYWTENPSLKYYGNLEKLTGEGIFLSAKAASLGPSGGSRVNLNPATEAASMDLRHYGIPGIRYLDGGSRGAGTGTSNFVVFPRNEDLLTILERNGAPLGLLSP
jgi:hypothetical protein